MSKKKMILKELDDGLVSVKQKLKKFEDADLRFLYLKQLKALEEINDFVSTYEWVGKSDDVKEKIKFIRESDFNYELVRSELKLSPDALKSLIFRANKKLTEKIGNSTLDLILSRKDTVSLGLIQFRICSKRYSLSDILLSELYRKLPDSKIDFFNIFDCENEIKLLYFFSKFSFEQEFLKCDLKKLAFLRYILENPVDRYKEEQKDLISLLQGVNISLDDYTVKLENLRDEYNNNNYAFYNSQNVKSGLVENEIDSPNLLDDELVSLFDESDESDDLSDLDGFESI